MKTMKFSCAALAAALVMAAPLVSVAAPDAKKEGKSAKTQEEKAAKAEAKPAKAPDPAPAREKPDEVAVAKALKMKKPVYTKFAEAKEAAWNCQQPLLVALLAGDDEKSKRLEARALRKREFAKDFVSANCVFLVWRLKPGKPEIPQGRGRRRGPPPKPTTIETRSMRAPETEFLSKFAVSPLAIANAKRSGGPEPKFSSINCYPTVLCVDPSCTKLYFRDPKYDTTLNNPNASFGVWFAELVEMFSNKTGREPVVTRALEKIIENPSEPKKWK